MNIISIIYHSKDVRLDTVTYRLCSRYLNQCTHSNTTQRDRKYKIDIEWETQGVLLILSIEQLHLIVQVSDDTKKIHYFSKLQSGWAHAGYIIGRYPTNSALFPLLAFAGGVYKFLKMLAFIRLYYHINTGTIYLCIYESYLHIGKVLRYNLINYVSGL